MVWVENGLGWDLTTNLSNQGTEDLEVCMKVDLDVLKERLGRYREIKITVTGRKSGKKISKPVWFVLEGNKVLLLPVKGSETQWYKNVLENPVMWIEARDVGAEVKAVPITNPKRVAEVVEKFREKYGPGDVKKYYSGLDVAVVAEVG